jgi:hypothetical protein
MASITFLASGSHAAGTYSLASTSVPLGIVQATLTLDRALWTLTARTAAVTMDISFDNGATWQSLGGFTAQGGTVTDPAGVTALVSSFTVDLPQPANANRRVRGSVVITGGAVNTAGILVLT